MNPIRCRFHGGSLDGMSEDRDAIGTTHETIARTPDGKDMRETYGSVVHVINGKDGSDELHYWLRTSEDVTMKLRESWAKFREETVRRVLDEITGAEDE